MIFKTFDNDVDKWTAKIGILGKSFNELGTAINDAFKSAIDNIDNLDENVGFWESLKNNLFSPKNKEDFIKNTLGEVISKDNIDSFIAELDLDSAKTKLKEIFDWNVTGEPWEEYFETLKGGKEYLIDLIKNTDDLSKLTGEDLVNANKAARDAAIAHNAAIQQQTLSAKAGQVALKGLAIAGNMIAMWLITKGIELAVKKVDELAHSAEHCKERVEELMSSYKSAIDTANSNAKKVEELADKYESLSKGVNSLGENVSLTTEEYKEYNSIVNDIADMFPTLIKGYTDEGNAILSLKGNVEQLRDAYKEAQQEAYNMLIVSGKDSDGNDIIKQWNDLHDTDFWDKLLDFGNDDVGKSISVTKAIELLEKIRDGEDFYSNITQNELNYLNKTLGLGSALFLTEEDFANAQRQARVLIQTYNAEIESALKDVETLANAYLMTNEDYIKLDEQSKNAASIIVNSLNANIASGFSSKEDVGAYVDDIVQTILTNTEAKDAMIGLFTIDTTDMPIDEAEYWINKYIDTIASIIGENPIELKIRLGFQDTDSLANNYRTMLNDAAKKVSGATDGEIINDRGRSKKYHEIYNAIDEFAKQYSINTQDEIAAFQKALEEANYDIEKAFENYLSEEITHDPVTLSISSTIDQLNTQLKPAFDSLKSAWDDIFTDDGSALNENIDILSVCDSIKSKLDEIAEFNPNLDYSAYENFVNVLSNSKSTTNDVEDAFDLLATSITQAALTGAEDFQTMKAALEDLGVVNNEIIAFDALIHNTEALKEAGLDLVEVSKMEADEADETIEAFVREIGITENLEQAIDMLSFQKELCNLQSMDTADEVANLRTLAENAGYTGEVIQYLTELEQIYQQVASDTLDAFDVGGKILRAAQLQTLIAQSASNIEYKPKVDFSGATKSAKSAGSSAGKAFTDALDKELAALDKKMEAGYIDFNDYINKRLGLIEDYYRQGKISADEYYSYLEKHYDTQLSYMDKVVSAVTRRIDKEIDGLEKQKDDIEEYYQLQIDSLEKEKTLLEEANKERQRQIDLQKALYEMEKARNQRTKLIYSEGKGMHYVADDQAIRSSEEDVADAQYEIKISEIEKSISKLEEARNQETSAIDEMIDKLQDYKKSWQDITSAYEEQQEDLIAAQILGADWEADILNGRLDTLNNFKDNYIAIQQAMVDATYQAAQAMGNTENVTIGDSSSGKQVSLESNTRSLQDAMSTVASIGSSVFQHQKYASGTNNAKKGLNLVGEDGAELYFDNHDHVAIVTKPTLIPMEGGEVVKNEQDTKKLLSSDNLKPVDNIGLADIDGKEAEYTIKVNIETNGEIPEVKSASLVKDNSITLADGTVLTPLQPGDPMLELQQKFDAYIAKSGGDTSSLMTPISSIQKDMERMVNSLNTVNNVSNNRMQQVNIGDINITCPGVTSQEVAKQIGVEVNNLFNGLHLDAYQQSKIR